MSGISKIHIDRDYEAIPMGFETSTSLKVTICTFIMKLSLWDLKLITLHDGYLIPKRL